MVELIRRNKKPVLKLRSKKPTLKRRIKLKPTLKRRKRKDVWYCERIKNRLPYPIECSWVGEMYDCCKKCERKIIYWYWKEGGYIELANRLENRTYKQTEASIKEEKETYQQIIDKFH